jgi:hypothetical protein
MKRFHSIRLNDDGSGFSGYEHNADMGGMKMRFQASFHLFLIRQAWADGVDYADLAIGGDQDDWSMLRDADEAHPEMLERALEHFFGDRSTVRQDGEAPELPPIGEVRPVVMPEGSSPFGD